MPFVPTPTVIDPSDSGVPTTVANGAATVILTARDVGSIKNYSLFIQNLGGGGGAAFQNAALQAGPLAAGPWVAINTTFAALAASTDAVVAVTDNSHRWIRAIAQGNAATTTARVYWRGVEYQRED